MYVRERLRPNSFRPIPFVARTQLLLQVKHLLIAGWCELSSPSCNLWGTETLRDVVTMAIRLGLKWRCRRHMATDQFPLKASPKCKSQLSGKKHAPPPPPPSPSSILSSCNPFQFLKRTTQHSRLPTLMSAVAGMAALNDFYCFRDGPVKISAYITDAHVRQKCGAIQDTRCHRIHWSAVSSQQVNEFRASRDAT